MTTHFSEDERVAAADGSLDAARRMHADTCAECRQAVDEVRSFLRQLADVEVPEPSPLFWDHFSRRVSAATALERGTAPASAWRAWLSLAATAATVFAAVWLVRQPAFVLLTPTDETASVDTAQTLDAEDVELDAVMAMPSVWSDDEWFAMTDEQAVSFEDLSSDERAMFVRLLNQQMDVMQ